MEVFVMIFIGLGIVAMLILFGFLIFGGVSTWVRNNNSPVETNNAVVVAKRTNVSGGGDSEAVTAYFVTFEREDGSRREFRVRPDDYGYFAEGDVGLLMNQGTRYLGFKRRSSEYSAIDPSEQVHTCKGCGATFRGTVCDYCGTPVEVERRSRRR